MAHPIDMASPRGRASTISTASPATASKMSPAGNAAPDNTLLVRVTVVEQSLSKCIMFDTDRTVWEAKQLVLDRLAKGLKDAINYGLYQPPKNGRAGKFLDENRLIGQYGLAGPVAELEFKLKRRVYKDLVETSTKARAKLHTRANLKKFFDHVVKNNVDRVREQLDKGFDPNMHCNDTGATPLTHAAAMDQVDMVVALVGGGALLDYRSKEGLTAVHTATQNGCLKSLTKLLDFGASPNYRDAKGLTPMYHSCSVTLPQQPHIRCAQLLLREACQLGIMDSNGWTELHQAAKRNNDTHVVMLLPYGADIHARNNAGQTPLHVAAAWDSPDVARVLLVHGADSSAKNRAGQTPLDVAQMAQSADMINALVTFDPSTVVPIVLNPLFVARRHSSASTTGTPTPSTPTRGPISHLQQHTQQHSQGPSQLPSVQTQHHPIVEFQLPKSFDREEMLSDAAPQGGTLHTVTVTKGERGFGFRLGGAKVSHVSGQSVRHVDKNGAAEAAGLVEGDRLVAVNGKNVEGCSHNDVIMAIKQGGPTVELTVRRNSYLPVHTAHKSSTSPPLSADAAAINYQNISSQGRDRSATFAGTPQQHQQHPTSPQRRNDGHDTRHPHSHSHSHSRSQPPTPPPKPTTQPSTSHVRPSSPSSSKYYKGRHTEMGDPALHSGGSSNSATNPAIMRNGNGSVEEKISPTRRKSKPLFKNPPLEHVPDANTPPTERRRGSSSASQHTHRPGHHADSREQQPPPPPPPPPIAPSPAHIQQRTSHGGTGGDGGYARPAVAPSLLLQQIQAGKKLKKVAPSAPKQLGTVTQPPKVSVHLRSVDDLDTTSTRSAPAALSHVQGDMLAGLLNVKLKKTKRDGNGGEEGGDGGDGRAKQAQESSVSNDIGASVLAGVKLRKTKSRLSGIGRGNSCLHMLVRMAGCILTCAAFLQRDKLDADFNSHSYAWPMTRF
eukprot:m.305885 g.305885  ORF g.305885 m.305885 type:complete len:949 (-) comp15912_c3_seq1:313-3159(-)